MKRTTLRQKQAIKAFLAQGKSYSKITNSLSLSLRMARKWDQIMKKGGSLEPKMGRPKEGDFSSFDKKIKSKIDQYRPGKEGWSALTR